MYYVYVIQNVDARDDVYIGYTSDLKRRIKQHNSQDNRGYTRRRKWRLVYYEAYSSDVDARVRERRLKHDGRARYQLMRRIHNSIGTMD